MIGEIDCRGMNCPAPVLHVRDTLEKEALIDVTVIVDNEAARQNVSRFLEHQNYLVRSETFGDDFKVVGTKGDVGQQQAPDLSSPVPVINVRETGVKKIMVLVTTVHMGHGDDGLGDMLMFNFLKTLKEMGPELWRVVFVNGGVSFTAEGSEAVPILQELVRTGVQVSACGACLAYLHILDKIRVGEVTNMLDIVTGMKDADTVVTI
ncbi:MAG: sulfurtransferase-like selenium metabolism protein YedF [Desulfuromonadaceae bacterium]|nr:sulfurtransferase-like selenium metabolism protein YedF [Desulfuromonadaceae bacterium]